MQASEQDMLADLLELWLRYAKIDFTTPPMLGEEEAEVRHASE
jgi:hypothetical protein